MKKLLQLLENFGAEDFEEFFNTVERNNNENFWIQNISLKFKSSCDQLIGNLRYFVILVIYNLKRELPSPCFGIRSLLKKDGYDRSDTEVGVLMAITCHGPAPPEGTYRHRWRVTQPPSLLNP
ncbi:hypothetical protein AVEN_257367-1 [Araneus ventricosus]|uniref:Uncharacterized protein n=1 Tax=Araneus ventricosus TaxID=182803 RepID=A0A4Y2CAF0_ARAVE|nr:hypothetical protein AVEN_257367-1 [Araneus ventricosus]